MDDRQWEPVTRKVRDRDRLGDRVPGHLFYSSQLFSTLTAPQLLEGLKKKKKNQSLGPTPGESVLIKLLSGEHRQQYLLKASQVILMSCQRELKTTDSKTQGETAGREPGALGGE